MGKKRGITRAFLGVAASNDISHNPVVPGGASVAVSCQLDIFKKDFFFLQKWLAHVWTQLFGQIRRTTKKERLLGVKEETKKS